MSDGVPSNLNLPRATAPETLPILAKREAILAALQSSQVLVLSGETGSGKTTQLPQFALQAGLGRHGQIGCTQPRRVAALSVSKRVAAELGKEWGREVGCKMRFHDATRPETQIKFMTDGILLAEIQSDPLLRRYSTLIIDEAHERSLNIDFLLGHLRNLILRRPDLKLILTSATIDTEVFSTAFGGAPVLEVSGRLWPVEIRYAPPESWGPSGDDDSDGQDSPSHIQAACLATAQALRETPSGDVLVFMPTERDIRETLDQLESLLGPRIETLGLFGRMPAAEQQRIFEPGPRRRVIVATNVAETSLTLPRIATVIDSGLARVSRYNPRTRTKRLPIEEIAQSNANQRAGRAGRVQNGLCIRLYSEENFQKRPRFTQPEIQRANLAEVILRMKAFGLGEIESFPFLNPPTDSAIRSGYRLLHELGALDSAQQLTPQGRRLAALPVDPTLGRLLLQAQSERVLPEALILASALSLQDPRERPEDQQEAARAAHQAFLHPQSDFLSLLRLWKASPLAEAKTSANALRRFCKSHFLSFLRMREWRDLHDQLAQTLRESLPPTPRPEPPPAGSRVTLTPTPANSTAPRPGPDPRRRKPHASPHAQELTEQALHRCLLAGFPGHLARKSERNLYQAAGGRLVHVFPGSALHERTARPSKNKGGKPPEKSRQPEWIVGAEIVETSRLFVRTVGSVRPEWILEIAPHLCQFRHVDPAWNPKAQRVLVSERVLIHGLEILRRPVDFGKIDPVLATELFIRGALVPFELDLPHRFHQANRELRHRLETALTRVRSGRLLDLDEAFYAFYAERIQNVSSLHDLNRLLRERLTAEPDFCLASEDDLLGATSAEYDPSLFPDQVSLENSVLPLSYAFAPGEEEDGVTVRIPLPLAQQLSQAQLQWIIPGLREEQIQVLLRALPKPIRKSLLPLEPKATEIAAEFQPGKAEFLPALADFLTRKYRIHIRASDWPPFQLPDHLQPRAEIVDRKNTPLAAGRQLDSIRDSLAAERPMESSMAFRNLARRFEKRGITHWNFGDLPEAVPVEAVGGIPMMAYPGLEREAPPGGASQGPPTVRIRLFESQLAAEQASGPAFRQLAEAALQSEIQRLRAQLTQLIQSLPRSAPNPAQPASIHRSLQQLGSLPGLGASASPSPERLIQTGLENLLRHSLSLAPVFPLHEIRFRDLVEAARRNWPENVRQLGGWLRELLELKRTLENSPKRYPELSADLQRLVPPDFLEITPFPRLPHLVRYLKAMRIRAERAALQPAKDQERARQLEPYRDWKKRVPAARHESFRWLLEEFRVSLFAQELGTAEPVSAPRLNALGEL
jgi:ATP-dependent helicase HrpA